MQIKQDKAVKHIPKRDSEKKTTELPRTGFMYMYQYCYHYVEQHFFTHTHVHVYKLGTMIESVSILCSWHALATYMYMYVHTCNIYKWPGFTCGGMAQLSIMSNMTADT